MSVKPYNTRQVIPSQNVFELAQRPVGLAQARGKLGAEIGQQLDGDRGHVALDALVGGPVEHVAD